MAKRHALPLPSAVQRWAAPRYAQPGDDTASPADAAQVSPFSEQAETAAASADDAEERRKMATMRGRSRRTGVSAESTATMAKNQVRDPAGQPASDTPTLRARARSIRQNPAGWPAGRLAG